MGKFLKKIIITGVMTVSALGALTACMKTEESSNNGESSAMAEEMPQAEGAEEAKSGETEEAKTADAQGADTKNGKDAQGVGTEAGTGEASSGETELMGMIEEIPKDSDDSFIIAKLVTEEVNGLDLVGTDPDDTKITVVHSMDTKFTKQTLKSGGENVKEEEGSAADLKENFTVEMKGSYSEEEENVFFATDVKIVEVISG